MWLGQAAFLTHPFGLPISVSVVVGNEYINQAEKGMNPMPVGHTTLLLPSTKYVTQERAPSLSAFLQLIKMDKHRASCLKHSMLFLTFL